MLGSFPSFAFACPVSVGAFVGGSDRRTLARRDPDTAGPGALHPRSYRRRRHIVRFGNLIGLSEQASRGVGQVGRDHGVSLNRLRTGPLAPQDTRVIDAVAK